MELYGHKWIPKYENFVQILQIYVLWREVKIKNAIYSNRKYKSLPSICFFIDLNFFSTSYSTLKQTESFLLHHFFFACEYT